MNILELIQEKAFGLKLLVLSLVVLSPFNLIAAVTNERKHDWGPITHAQAESRHDP